MRWLGREPALWLAAISVLVKLIAAFWIGLSTDQQALINAAAAAAAGLVIAGMTRDGLSAAILGLVQAGLALALGLGLGMPADQQAVLMSAAESLVAMFVRTQATAPVTHEQSPT